MRISILLLFIGFGFCSNAQFCDSLYAERVFETNGFRTNILNNGELFQKDNEPYHFHNFEGIDRPNISNFNKAGIWIGGFNPGGQLRVAAVSPWLNGPFSDFAPGPLNPDTGEPYEHIPCSYLNKIWEVTRDEILAHIEDFRDNGVIDNPIFNIMNWPAKGNINIEIHPELTIAMPNRTHGYAPFWDEDGDGLYNPLKGDFPAVDLRHAHLLPNKIMWTVFNDVKLHVISETFPLHVEVQLTAWMVECPDNQSIDNTLFLNYRVINMGQEAIVEGKFGFYADFNIGCESDDYIGSQPSQNAFFGYNANEYDQGQNWDCPPEISHGFNTPMPVVSYRLWEDMDYFTYFNNVDQGPPTYSPRFAQEYYNYLSGRWPDGEPLTFGHDGYNPGNTDTVQFAFSDDPTDSLGWSLKTVDVGPNRFYGIGSANMSNVREEQESWLSPGATNEFLIAVTTIEKANRNLKEQYDRIDIDFQEMQNFLTNSSSGICAQTYSPPEKEPEEEQPGLKIYPNPAFQNLTIEYPKPVQRVQFFDVSGRLIHEIRNPEEAILNTDVGNWSRGIYFAEITIEGYKVVEKVVLMN